MNPQLEAPLRPAGLSLANWLQFADHRTHFDGSGATIPTNMLTRADRDTYDEVGWEREDWEVNAVLVRLDAAKHAILEDLDDVRRYQLGKTTFAMGWSGREFNFGEYENFGQLTLQPWIIRVTDPLTEKLAFEPRPDFIRYHGLRTNPGDGPTIFRQPVEDIAALTLQTTISKYDELFLSASVHRDYLRDYLAARSAALAISVTGDRFTVVSSGELTGIEGLPEHDIDDHVSILPILRDTLDGNTFARVTLYETLIVLPFDRPNTNRTLWYYGGPREPNDDQAAPTFLVDANRTRMPARAAPRFLYFQLRVLEYYLNTDGYAVSFHMRTWGSATGPGNRSVTCGVNDRGLVSAYAYQIAALPNNDQIHWAQYSAAPDGPVCVELEQTQEQQNPPDSPSVIELLEAARVGIKVRGSGGSRKICFANSPQSKLQPKQERRCE